MQFRRKPIVIEAEQFHLGQQLSAWMAKATCHGSETCAEHRRRHVHTMHENQIVILADGDWVTPEPDGVHFYPIKNAVLMQNFDLVNDTPSLPYRDGGQGERPNVIAVAPELPVPVDWTPASVAELIRRHSLNLQQVTALLQAEQEV
jgi:hypothetical protein